MEGGHDDHDDKPVGAFIVSMVACFLITLLFGLPPILSQRAKLSPSAISASNCFSAGIFITLGLLLFLPEVIKFN
jgi:hypothetical protein